MCKKVSDIKKMSETSCGAHSSPYSPGFGETVSCGVKQPECDANPLMVSGVKVKITQLTDPHGLVLTSSVNCL